MTTRSTPPLTYGDVTREYRAARSEQGQVEGLYDLVWFGGTDAVTFLESLISQNVIDQEPGTVRRSFLLGPKGKLTAVMWVLRDIDRVGLVTDAGYGEIVADTLSRYRIRVDVTIEHDPRTLTTIVGPESPSVTGWSDTGDLVAGLPLAGNTRSITTGDSDIAKIGALAWTAVRVEAGEPVMGVDIDEKTIPQESGLVPSAVDFDKGCFLGQELVARIDSRGHVNRRLMGVMVTTNILPPAGAEVVVDDKVVGALSSPCESLSLRSPIGLAMIRSEVGAGQKVMLRWDDVESPAVVADLPMVG